MDAASARADARRSRAARGERPREKGFQDGMPARGDAMSDASIDDDGVSEDRRRFVTNRSSHFSMNVDVVVVDDAAAIFAAIDFVVAFGSIVGAGIMITLSYIAGIVSILIISILMNHSG